MGSRTHQWAVWSCGVAVVLLMSTGAAFAQDKPATFNFGIGFITPTGDVGDRFDTGVNIPFGVTFNINEQVGIQGEYAYSWMGGPEGTVTPIGGSPTLLETNHSMHMGSANILFKSRGGSGVGGYGIGGIGIYHRSVELTTPAVGLVTVCDPWWFVCFPEAVEVDQVIGSRSTTDFGFNVGGGVTFGRFYVEARFHYVFGPEFTTAGGTTVDAKGYYFPVVAGLRF